MGGAQNVTFNKKLGGTGVRKIFFRDGRSCLLASKNFLEIRKEYFFGVSFACLKKNIREKNFFHCKKKKIDITFILSFLLMYTPRFTSSCILFLFNKRLSLKNCMGRHLEYNCLNQ